MACLETVEAKGPDLKVEDLRQAIGDVMDLCALDWTHPLDVNDRDYPDEEDDRVPFWRAAQSMRAQPGHEN